jgi:hypothetical protein
MTSLPEKLEKQIQNKLNTAMRILDEAMASAQEFWPEATASAFVSIDSGKLQLYIARDEDSLEMLASKLSDHSWDAIVG